MEHQSEHRPEPIPKDVKEYFTPQKEKLTKVLSNVAIDAVRSSGWHNYNGDENED